MFHTHQIRLLYNLYFIFRCCYLITKKTNSENVTTPKVGFLNAEFAIKLWIYGYFKSFMSQMNPKEVFHNTA